MRLARAAVAEQDDRLAGADPVARREGREGTRRDRRRGGKIELGQALEPREAGLGDAPFPPPALPVVDLRRQELGEVRPVGDPVTGSGCRELVGLGTDRRQVQDACGDVDRDRRCLLGQAPHRAVPVSRPS